MKMLTRYLAVALMISASAITSAPCAESKPQPKPAPKKAAPKDPNLRQWKSVSGAVIEAAYVETKYGKVTLRGADGKLLVIPLYRLSAADRAYAAKLEEQDKTGGGIKEFKAPNRLPVFAAGKWANCHAVYQAKTFDATMNTGGAISIYPKVKGKRVGKPITCNLGCYYYNKNKRMSGRGIKRFALRPQPKMQPDQITLAGSLKDNIPFSVTFEFSDKGIKAYGYCRDPKDIEFPTTFRVGARVPASHNFGNDTPLDERKRILDGWQLIVDRASGKATKYDYSTSYRGIGGKSDKITIAAPVYGERQIRFHAGDIEGASIRPYIYSGYCPWQGYYIGMYKSGDNAASRSKKQYFRIDVR